MLCNCPLPEIYLQEEIENLSHEWRYNFRVREHMPACSWIYFDPFRSLQSVEVPFTQIWPEIVFQYSGENVLKIHERGSRAFLDINFSYKILFMSQM